MQKQALEVAEEKRVGGKASVFLPESSKVSSQVSFFLFLRFARRRAERAVQAGARG